MSEVRAIEKTTWLELLNSSPRWRNASRPRPYEWREKCARMPRSNAPSNAPSRVEPPSRRPPELPATRLSVCARQSPASRGNDVLRQAACGPSRCEVGSSISRALAHRCLPDRVSSGVLARMPRMRRRMVPARRSCVVDHIGGDSALPRGADAGGPDRVPINGGQ